MSFAYLENIHIILICITFPIHFYIVQAIKNYGIFLFLCCSRSQIDFNTNAD